MFSRGTPISEGALRAATETLHHRGPDGRKQWIAPSRRVGLGHARLSIIDLATGDQPLASEDGAVHAVVNGEFYDFQRIRGELEACGHRFATRSDSEILVHLYEELGAHAVHRLNGEYAFVLWDAARRTLLAGRDRFGIKPLVYALAGDALYLASEAKALFAAGVPARWDAEAVLQACYVATPEQTLFAGVRSVPPGGLLRATDRTVDTTTYWDFELPRAGEARMDAAEAVAGVRTHLATAVRRRLRADVPVCASSAPTQTRT
jgi:asparagine synthase (glutamine-hydrolysing)